MNIRTVYIKNKEIENTENENVLIFACKNRNINYLKMAIENKEDFNIKCEKTNMDVWECFFSSAMKNEDINNIEPFFYELQKYAPPIENKNAGFMVYFFARLLKNISNKSNHEKCLNIYNKLKINFEKMEKINPKIYAFLPLSNKEYDFIFDSFSFVNQEKINNKTIYVVLNELMNLEIKEWENENNTFYFNDFNDDNLKRHSVIFGTTGSGKSRFGNESNDFFLLKKINEKINIKNLYFFKRIVPLDDGIENIKEKMKIYMFFHNSQSFQNIINNNQKKYNIFLTNNKVIRKELLENKIIKEITENNQKTKISKI